ERRELRGRPLHVRAPLRARPRERLRPLARATFVLDTGPVDTGDVLTDDAIELLTDLERESVEVRAELPAGRAGRLARLSAAELTDFLPDTAAVREGDWRIAP